jgi:hypothetical protein
MSKLYLWSRILAGFFGFTALLGVLWFSASQGKVFVIAALSMGFSSLIAVFVPLRTLSSTAVRVFLIVLCTVGVSAGLVLVVDDLMSSSGIEWSEVEWDVVAIRLLHTAALAAMAIVALKWSPEST